MKRQRFEGNEIILTDDIEDNSIALVENIDDAFGVIGNTAVITGLEVTQSVTPDMNVIIPIGIAYDSTVKNIHVNLDSITASVTAADATQDRRDIVEIRRIEEEGSLATRQFKNAATGVITTSAINTETEYNIEVNVVEGTPGGSAPSVETGWIKIAEILVPAASSTVIDSRIYNCDAEAFGLSNTSWTTDIQSIFKNGSISDMVTSILANKTSSALNTTHRTSNGNNHSNVVLNNTHRTSNGNNHSNVVLNNTHRSSNGTDHTYIDQDLRTTADVTHNSVSTDTITENTSGAGVTIDGVTIKGGESNVTPITNRTSSDTPTQPSALGIGETNFTTISPTIFTGPIWAPVATGTYFCHVIMEVSGVCVISAGTYSEGDQIAYINAGDVAFVACTRLT